MMVSISLNILHTQQILPPPLRSIIQLLLVTLEFFLKKTFLISKLYCRSPTERDTSDITSVQEQQQTHTKVYCSVMKLIITNFSGKNKRNLTLSFLFRAASSFNELNLYNRIGALSIRFRGKLACMDTWQGPIFVLLNCLASKAFLRSVGRGGGDPFETIYWISICKNIKRKCHLRIHYLKYLTSFCLLFVC